MYISPSPGGGLKSINLRSHNVKSITPSRTAARPPYPLWHRFDHTLPLLAQTFYSKPHPYWHRLSTRNHTFTGTPFECHLQTDTHESKETVPSVAQPLENPYPHWHWFSVQTPTLGGTWLEDPTLCGTEICKKGTLAVLASAYWR